MYLLNSVQGTGDFLLVYVLYYFNILPKLFKLTSNSEEFFVIGTPMYNNNKDGDNCKIINSVNNNNTHP